MNAALPLEEELRRTTARLALVEDELAWKTAFLEAQANSSLDGIIVVDQDGKKILQNERVTDLFRIPQEIAEDKDDGAQVRWVADMTVDPAHFIERVSHLYAHREEVSRDEIELKNGTILDRYSSPVVGKEGTCYGRIWTFRDITQRKKAEAERDRLAAILDSTTDLVGVSDARWNLLYLNRAGRRLVGVGKDEDISKLKFVDFLPDPANHPTVNEGIPTALKDGTWSGEVLMVSRSGVEVPVSQVILAHKSAAGKLEFLSTIMRDISVRRQLEARLFQSRKMETVGELAGGIAHEFNSILTAIIGQSELMLADLPDGSPLVTNATEIHQAAGRAAALTRQLLAYGRRQFLQPEVLNLNQVVADLGGMFHHLLGGDVSIQVIPGHHLCDVKADAGQIEQVIVNMALNARDAMPKGGKFVLETSNVTITKEDLGRYPELSAGDFVMLAISDTGVGMPADVQTRVFEPFFSTKDVGRGTGLGLSSSYGIIKQSGGHISVYSEPGRGTTFKIYLPQIARKTAASVNRIDSPDLPRGTETVLLVEDDPALREMAATLLRRLGYKVLAAANGIEALALRQGRDVGHIDLLFTDVVMPHMSGKELSGRVQAANPHTRTLFTSAYTENAVVHQGVLDRGVSLLPKPFTPAALARKLREVLDQPVAMEAGDVQQSP